MGCLLPSRTRCLILALVFCGIASALADTSDQQTPAPPPPLVSITDSNASQLERQADQLCQQKRYLDAMDYYNAALTKEPTADRYNKLGMSYIHMQRFPEAEKSFEHALKLDKNSAAGYNNRGWIYQKNGNYGRAIKYFKKALALKPTSSTSITTWARLTSRSTTSKRRLRNTAPPTNLIPTSSNVFRESGHHDPVEFSRRSRRVLVHGR